jgi:hypothetical protein
MCAPRWSQRLFSCLLLRWWEKSRLARCRVTAVVCCRHVGLYIYIIWFGRFSKRVSRVAMNDTFDDSRMFWQRLLEPFLAREYLSISLSLSSPSLLPDQLDYERKQVKRINSRFLQMRAVRTTNKQANIFILGAIGSFQTRLFYSSQNHALPAVHICCCGRPKNSRLVAASGVSSFRAFGTGFCMRRHQLFLFQ